MHLRTATVGHPPVTLSVDEDGAHGRLVALRLLADSEGAKPFAVLQISEVFETFAPEGTVSSD